MPVGDYTVQTSPWMFLQFSRGPISSCSFNCMCEFQSSHKVYRAIPFMMNTYHFQKLKRNGRRNFTAFIENWEFLCVGTWDGYYLYINSNLKNFIVSNNATQ